MAGPRPWCIRDFAAEFLGYEGPAPANDPKKQPDWTKPKPPTENY